jgi:nitrite reductase/ring-hydroxylating ferredoxin subunit
VKQVICEATELRPGQMVSGKLGPMPIVVIRTNDGALYGLLDKCLHQGGPLSRGKLLQAIDCSPGRSNAYQMEGREIVKCPWHGYEYDPKTGSTLFDPDRKLRTFKVHEENGQVSAARPRVRSGSGGAPRSMRQSRVRGGWIAVRPRRGAVDAGRRSG